MSLRLSALAIAFHLLAAISPAQDQLAAPTAYILDGTRSAFALYPGPDYRPEVPPSEMINSLKELEKRASKLPPGTKIYWTTNTSPGTAPTVVMAPDQQQRFEKFCKKHGIQFIATHILNLAPAESR